MSNHKSLNNAKTSKKDEFYRTAPFMPNRKIEGQYMTPDPIVSMILHASGYTGQLILTKNIMEPSFGEGAFLRNIVAQLIIEGRKAGLSETEIAEIINSRVYGIEKDRNLYHRAIDRLNHLLDAFGIPNVAWDNLICGDTLIEYKSYVGAMDYVVGNPPYVRVHNLQPQYRALAKEFRFANGIIDLYVVFYEIGIMMLNDTGKLGFISPNSFLQNTSQQAFRNYLAESGYLSAIYDFKTSTIFDDADTYTCICLLNKDQHRSDSSVDYKEFSMYQEVASNRFEQEYFQNQLHGKAWNLCSEENIQFLEENKDLPLKVQDIAIVQNGIVTNCDKVYVIHAYEDEELSIPYMGKHMDKERIVYFRDKGGKVCQIESTILHRLVKASRFNGVMDNTYIIFPYIESSAQKRSTCIHDEMKTIFCPLTEQSLRRSFPKAYEYLSSFRDELAKRDMDKNTAWFLFGRSQGLHNSCYKKIVFKHIMNKATPVIEPHVLDEDVIVYSGMYTIINPRAFISSEPRCNENDTSNTNIFHEPFREDILESLCRIFASKDFARYCVLSGKPKSGGYVEVSTKMIKQFGITESLLPNFSGVI